MIGIVTDRDLASRVVVTNIQAADVMMPNPVVCHSANDLDTALEMMANHQIRRNSVVDKDGQIVGIITQADIGIHSVMVVKAGQMIRRFFNQTLYRLVDVAQYRLEHTQ